MGSSGSATLTRTLPSLPARQTGTIMLPLCLLLSLSSLSLALTVPEPVDPVDPVNEIIDLVDSGLDSPPTGRALFITLSITETTFTVSTISTDLTTVSMCLDMALPACAKKRSLKESFEGDYESLIQTSPPGTKVDLETIRPTSRSSMLEGLDVDGIILEEDALTSGTLSYREVAVENMNPGCGRADGIPRRPRFVVADKSTTIKTFSTTSITSTVYSSTATFSIPAGVSSGTDLPSDAFLATAAVCA